MTVVADRIATMLASEGVEFVVGFPENRLFNAAALAGIRPIITRTERVAVNIADGFARVTGGRRLGACAVQYGPGAEAAFAAVAQAYGDRTPLLLLPGAYPRSEQHVEPNFDAEASYRQITSWATTVNEAAHIPEALRRAFGLVRGTPANGPVLVAFANDLLWEPSPEPLGALGARGSSRPGVSAASADGVAKVVDELLGASNPVIVAGQGVLCAEAWDELRELAELTCAPVATTLNGKSAFAEDHPLALGTMGRSRPATVDHFFAQADLVLGVGTSFTRSLYLRPLPAGARLGQITSDPRGQSADYDISFGCTGDAKLTLRQIIEEVRRRDDAVTSADREAVTAEIRAVSDDFAAAWDHLLNSDSVPINPYRVINELMNTVDRSRTVVTHDAGNPRDQMVPFYESVVPHGYIGWGKSTQLGTGLGLAIGARLARPDWLAVNVMGDAAFGMVGMDFETAVRCELPILTIVLNNGVMGGYRAYMPDAIQRYEANRLGGDYAAVARALGGYAERVADPSDLRPALERAIESVSGGTAALVEVITSEEPVVAVT